MKNIYFPGTWWMISLVWIKLKESYKYICCNNNCFKYFCNGIITGFCLSFGKY